MKTLKNALLIGSLILASGCGKAPDLTTAAPLLTDAANTQVFAYNQFTQICNALKTWNPLLTNVQFPNDPAGLSIYYFSATGIKQNGIKITLGAVDVGVFPFTCVVTIANGSITSVQ